MSYHALKANRLRTPRGRLKIYFSSAAGVAEEAVAASLGIQFYNYEDKPVTHDYYSSVYIDEADFDRLMTLCEILRTA